MVPVCFIILNMKFNKVQRNINEYSTSSVGSRQVFIPFTRHWFLCLGRGQMEMSVTKFPFVLRKKNKNLYIMGELPHPFTALWIQIWSTFGSRFVILNYGSRPGLGVRIRIRILTIYQRFEEISEKNSIFIMSETYFFSILSKISR